MLGRLYENVVTYPDRHNKDHASIKSLAEAGKATRLLKLVPIARELLLLIAKAGGDVFGLAETGEVCVGLLDHLAVLNVKAADSTECTRVGTVVCDELGHDGHLLLSVQSVGAARSVVGLVAPSVRVEVTTILVAVGAVTLVSDATSGSARAWPVRGAWVRSQCIGDGVGFPNVHLGTA